MVDLVSQETGVLTDFLNTLKEFDKPLQTFTKDCLLYERDKKLLL